MKITITLEDLAHVKDEGTILVFTGTDQETGDLVAFGVDHRVAEGLYQAALDEEVTAEVESWQVVNRLPLRKGRVARSSIGGPTGDVVRQYLPNNYQVTEVTPEFVYFQGHDVAGWTLDDYVIPRLGSGLIHAEEVK